MFLFFYILVNTDCVDLVVSIRQLKDGVIWPPVQSFVDPQYRHGKITFHQSHIIHAHQVHGKAWALSPLGCDVLLLKFRDVLRPDRYLEFVRRISLENLFPLLEERNQVGIVCGDVNGDCDVDGKFYSRVGIDPECPRHVVVVDKGPCDPRPKSHIPYLGVIIRFGVNDGRQLPYPFFALYFLNVR